MLQIAGQGAAAAACRVVCANKLADYRGPPLALLKPIHLHEREAGIDSGTRIAVGAFPLPLLGGNAIDSRSYRSSARSLQIPDVVPRFLATFTVTRACRTLGSC